MFCPFCGARVIRPEPGSGYGPKKAPSKGTSGQKNTSGTNGSKNAEKGNRTDRTSESAGTSWSSWTEEGEESSGSGSVMDTVVTVAAAVFMIFYLIVALRGLFSVIQNVSSLFSSRIVWTVESFLSYFVYTVTAVVFVLMLGLFAFRRNSKNGEALYVGVLIGAGVRIIGSILRYIIAFIMLLGFSGRPAMFSFIREGLIALIAAGVLYFVSWLDGNIYFFGKNGESFRETVVNSGNIIMTEIGRIPEFTARIFHRENTGSKTGYEAVGGITTKRSILKYIIFSILTCGLYDLYFTYAMARDVNRMCEGDGQHTTGLVKFLIFSFFTCSIYTFFWNYNLAERMQDNGKKYGVTIKEGGSTILLWMILGTLLCGVGRLFAIHMQIRNFNKLAEGYNKKLMRS